MIQNGGDFAHFDEKSGTAAREIVAGADARKDAVGDGKLRLAGRNEGAHLRHQDDERGLTQIGGLAAHVRAGDEKKLLTPGLEAEIIGNEALSLLPQEFFDHRMAPADDEKFAGGVEFRAGITAIRGELGKRGEHVELRDGSSGAAQSRSLGGNRRADIDEKLALDFEDAFVGGENFALVFLQFG